MILLPYLAKATLIISAAASVLALDRRSSAAFRHLICALAVGGLLALPILSSALPAWELSGVGPANHLRQGYGGQEAGHYELIAPPEGLSRRSREAKADGHYDLSGPAASFAPGAMEAEKAGHYELIAPPEGLSRRSREAKADGHYVLPEWMWVAVYLAGVLWLFARVVVDRFKVRRIARGATPLNDAGWQALFHECRNALGVRRRVQLLRSADRATPMAIGIRHPAIVVPALADAWSTNLRTSLVTTASRKPPPRSHARCIGLIRVRGGWRTGYGSNASSRATIACCRRELTRTTTRVISSTSPTRFVLT